MQVTMPVTAMQFKGQTSPEVIFQKAQRVDLSSTRGIVFDRPDRWVVNTPVGQIEISIGDWLVRMASGRVYVVKDEDMPHAKRAPASSTRPYAGNCLAALARVFKKAFTRDTEQSE